MTQTTGSTSVPLGPPKNTVALVAMIVGIVALALSPVIVGGFMAFVAIFLGVVAQGNQGRRGMAVGAIVMGIVAILASGLAIFVWYVALHVAPAFRGPMFAGRGAPMAAASMDISNLTTALDTFEVDNGRYPSNAEGLNGLVVAPAGLGATWKGPYIMVVKSDPWGRPYVYHEPVAGAPRADVLSLGPDGIEGTADDIR